MTETEINQELAAFHDEIFRLSQLPDNNARLFFQDKEEIKSLGEKHLVWLETVKSMLTDLNPAAVLERFKELNAGLQSAEMSIENSAERKFIDWVRNAIASVCNSADTFQRFGESKYPLSKFEKTRNVARKKYLGIE